jgi:hypothetical protein
VRGFGRAGTVKTVRPSAGTLAALTLAIVLAACGGGADTTAAQAAALPRAVADDLAAKSDEIADALDRGDQCGAAHHADELKDEVEAAVADGRVPAAYQGELERTATELQNAVNCDERGKENKDQDQDQDQGKGKKKGHDDTTTLGTTVSTTTGESG